MQRFACKNTFVGKKVSKQKKVALQWSSQTWWNISPAKGLPYQRSSSDLLRRNMIGGVVDSIQSWPILVFQHAKNRYGMEEYVLLPLSSSEEECGSPIWLPQSSNIIGRRTISKNDRRISKRLADMRFQNDRSLTLKVFECDKKSVLRSLRVGRCGTSTTVTSHTPAFPLKIGDVIYFHPTKYSYELTLVEVKFEQQSITLVPFGSDVSRTRLSLWKTRLEELGATVSKDITEKTTIVVVSSQLGLERFLKEMAISALPPPPLRFVTPQWVTQSLFLKKPARIEGDLVWCPSNSANVPSCGTVGAAEVGHERQEQPPAPKEGVSKKCPLSVRGVGGDRTVGRQDVADRLDPSRALQHSSAAGSISSSSKAYETNYVEDGGGGGLEKSLQVCKVRAKPVNLVVQDEQFASQLISRCPWLQRTACSSIIPPTAFSRDSRSKFACQISGTLSAVNYNSNITNMLPLLSADGDTWRVFSYKRASSLLKHLNFRVQDWVQVKHLRGLGKGMLSKVKEILETGKLEKLDTLKSNPRVRALNELSAIWGVGPTTARQFMSKGFMSVASLRSEAGQRLLTPQQRVGLECFEDFLCRMPRWEVAALEGVVKGTLAQLCPAAKAIVCGSYRRGKSSCGDIDILITDPTKDACSDLLPTLVRALTDQGFLTHHLALPSSLQPRKEPERISDDEESGGGGGGGAMPSSPGENIPVTGSPHQISVGKEAPKPAFEDIGDTSAQSYMGVCRLPASHRLPPADVVLQNEDQVAGGDRDEEVIAATCEPLEKRRYRRIDIKVYPRSQFGLAQLYFTGSDHFNRSMRLYCKRVLKCTLSDKTLAPASWIGTEKVWEGESIVCPTEQSVFQSLGLEYRSPTQRNCYDVQFDLEDEESEKRANRGNRRTGGTQVGTSKKRLHGDSSPTTKEIFSDGDVITELLKRRKVKLP